MMLLAVFAPWAANAQTALPWSENFEGYTSTTLGSEWATPAMYGGNPCVLTNNGWASPAGQNSLECRTNNSNPIVFVFPQFDKNLNWLNVQFKIRGHADGRGEFGYVTNANNASTFTKLTDISPQPAVVGNSPGYTSYNYDLSTMNAPDNSSYRLAVRYTFVGSGEDSWYFDDFSVTYTEPSGGDSSGELTVYDGTVTSQEVPMFVFYFDDFTRSQFVIPAADLTDMAGGTINSIKFYTKSDYIPYTTVADFDIYVKEVNYTTITALEAKSSATIVYQGIGNFVEEGSGGSITITFNTPYTYNGGNLLIGCDNTTNAGFREISFYGQKVSGASTGASNSSSLDQVGFKQQDFIPKTTFFYTLDGNCEDFESVEGVNAPQGAGYMPEGWNYIYTGSNIGYRPKVYNGDSYKPSGLFATDIGNNILMMIAGNSSGYGENTYVILPPYENVTGISFNAWRESASNGTLYFGYITNANDASTFHQLQQLTTVNYRDANTTNASFEYNDLSIPSGARLAFRWNHNNSWYSAFIDNVCVKVDAETAFTKEILAHSTGEETSGWYLIASPLYSSISVNAVDQMTDNEFDLYRFNQAPTANGEGQYLEWENYKSHTEDFLIESGIGYLYANSGNVTLTFTGYAYEDISNEHDKAIQLKKTDDNPDANMRGWNLVGNPYGRINAYIDREFYVMNPDGNDIVPSGERNYIEPMEGVFVLAQEDEELFYFRKIPANSTGNKGSLCINVTEAASHRGNRLIDRAVVRFGEGNALPKFQLNPNHTKVYIPQGNKDCAVVYSEGQGEMPLSFRANENGTYTLSFNAEEVSFSYLHLIDNMTGADVDLLAATSTGSVATYTFEARTTDYSSRFKLVFATGSNNDSDNFSFFSNGTWVIGNEGEATLQVVDVTGRILSSETVNGSVSKAINAAPGVYMLRLINGDNVKVQKIVVR